MRLRVLANPATRAILAYLACVPASSVLSTVVGSVSEYRCALVATAVVGTKLIVSRRFPHPLLTTTLHLAISLSTLIALAFAASAVLRLSTARRQLSSGPNAPVAASTTLQNVLAALASHRPSARTLSSQHLAAALTPYILSASMAAVLASLVESRAARITEPPFWTLARLLPLAITAVAAALPTAPHVLDDVTSTTVAIATCVWFVLVAGPAVAWGASAEGWMCGLVYAFCVVGWVLSIKGGLKDGEELGDDGETK